MSQGRVDVDEGGQAVGAEQFFGVGCVAGGWERVAGAEIINGQVAFPRLQLSVTVAGLFFVQINFDLGVAFGELLQDRRHHGKGEQGSAGYSEGAAQSGSLGGGLVGLAVLADVLIVHQDLPGLFGYVFTGCSDADAAVGTLQKSQVPFVLQGFDRHTDRLLGNVQIAGGGAHGFGAADFQKVLQVFYAHKQVSFVKNVSCRFATKMAIQSAFSADTMVAEEEKQSNNPQFKEVQQMEMYGFGVFMMFCLIIYAAKKKKYLLICRMDCLVDAQEGGNDERLWKGLFQGLAVQKAQERHFFRAEIQYNIFFTGSFKASVFIELVGAGVIGI